MFRFTFCLSLLSLVSILSGFGQTTGVTYKPRLNPVSPSAYEFMKYGDIPVGEYTGVPNISIPIYTVKMAGLTIPVDLTYHAAGVRVSEEASWVGLGWNINVGGSITQIVNGMDDFGYYQSRFDIKPSVFDNVPQGADGNCTVIIAGYDELSHDNDPLIPYQYLSGYEDSEPDIFKFSVLNWSGEFVLDWVANSYTCLSDKNIVVTPLNINHNGRPSSFEIKVPEGHRFRFQLKEETLIDRQVTRITQNPDGRQHPGGPPMGQEASSRTYKLIQIVTNEADYVGFEYVMSDEVVNLPSVSVTKEYNEEKIPGTIGQDWLNVVRSRFPYAIEYTNYTSTTQRLAYVHRITTGKEIIEFNSAPGRLDFDGTRQLNEITVKSPNNVIHSRHLFNYGYFVGHADGADTDNYLHYLNITKSAEELTHRLKLLSVQKVGEPSHTFDYFEEPLPKKTSLATDYWGYYNRVLSNASMFPNFYRFGLRYDTGLGNNKSADLMGTKAACLTGITYPTGGRTEFDYALNSFDNYFAPDMEYFDDIDTGGSFSLEVSDNNDGSHNTFEVVRLPELGAHFTGQIALSGPCVPLTYDQENIWVKVIKIKEEKALIWDRQPWQIGSILQDPANFEWEETFDFAPGEMTETDFSKFIDVEYLENTPGLMVFEAQLADGCGPQNAAGESGFAAANIDYVTFGDKLAGPNEGIISQGAGLRVHAVRNYADQGNSKTNETVYEYEEGKLMSPLTFIDQYDSRAYFKYLFRPYLSNVVVCFSPQWYGTTTKINTASIIPYSTSASGSYVGYGRVTKKQLNVIDGTAGNGKVVTEFVNNPDDGAINFIGNGIFTSLPLTKHYPINGLLESSTTYDNNDTPVRRIDNTWGYRGGYCVYGLKPQWKEQTQHGFSCETVYKQHYHIGLYPLRQVESIQLSQQVTEFWGTEEQSTTTSYHYNSRNEIERQTFVDSQGDTQETRFFYPYDRSSVFIMDQMVSYNYIAPVVETEEYLNNTLIRKRKTDYTSSPGYFAPRQISTSRANDPLTTEITFDRYENERLVQYTPRDGPSVTLLWGYDHEYVVAQIINANYTECSALVDLSVLQSPASESALLSELHKLRNGLPHARVATYSHNALQGVSAIADQNNQMQSFDYDALGRLIGVKDNDAQYLSTFKYNFADPQSANIQLRSNFIKSERFNVEVGNPDLPLPEGLRNIAYAYSDGLGRAVQTVRLRQSPKGFDIVQPKEYDAYGRESKLYLPYVSGTDGRLKSIIPALYNFYQDQANVAHDPVPYAERRYEASPLNRVLEQGSEGTVWQIGSGNTSAFEYKLSHLQDVVFNWDVDATTDALTLAGYYAPNELQKNVTKDAHRHAVIEFVDKLDRVVLKRVQAVTTPNSVYITGQWADTYYVYDDFGNLRYVIPPEAVKEYRMNLAIPFPPPSQGFLNQWVFQYKYDGRDRMTEKRVPGGDWTYLVYDERDRLVLTQDGNQRINGQWSFTKYDELNRPIITGIYSSTASRTQVQEAINTGSYALFEVRDNAASYGYSNQSFPNTGIVDHYSITYYDTYDFRDNLSEFGSGFSYEAPNHTTSGITTPRGTYNYEDQAFVMVKGQVTGSLVRVLGSNEWLKNVSYYDDSYRLIQSVSKNTFHGTTERISRLYNFPGWLLETFKTQTRNGTAFSVRNRYTYDHAGRLMAGYHELYEGGVGQGEVFLAENKYNELGELIEKNLHVEAGVPHQSIDYRYNIRGWLKSVNTSSLLPSVTNEDTDQPKDLFGMELLYNTALEGIPTNE